MKVLATSNSCVVTPALRGRDRWKLRPKPIFLELLLLLLAITCEFSANAAPASTDAPANQTVSNINFAQQARQRYETAQVLFQSSTNGADAHWQFARACFDWAEFATSKADRARIAQQGIAACRRLLERNPNSAPGHYYLSMNLGQLARTKELGALRLVDQMEEEFKTALALDPDIDFAGPERNLGLLYLDAPGWPASIGNNAKARQYLQKALKRSPSYPDNRLNLIEAELKWNNREAARQNLKALTELWPAARQQLNGPEWGYNWAEWENRRAAAEKELDEFPKSSHSGHRT